MSAGEERDELTMTAIRLSLTSQLSVVDSLALLTKAGGYVAARDVVRDADHFLYELAAWFDDVLSGGKGFEEFYDVCAHRCIPTADAMTKSVNSAVTD